MKAEIERFLVSAEATIREVMACIDRNAKGVALIVDDERRLLAAITDGDIRRGILAGIGVDAPVSALVARKAQSSYPKAITAPQGVERTALVKLVQERGIRQIPLLDDEGRVVELVTAEELMPSEVLPLQAVVMAGGFGKRLRPLTEDMPKPMLPVGDRPLLEHMIGRLRDAGIQRVNITTHYMPEKISDHFGNGEAFGVDIDYVAEDRPLGTAGSLALMDPPPTETLLVMNGDLLTTVDFRSMLAFHRKHEAELTVCVRQYDLQVPYGVLESEGAVVKCLREKPTYSFLVNAGIYLLEPLAHASIPAGRRFDMTDLIQLLITEDRRVVNFPIVEYWMDIGQPEDYEEAQEYVRRRERES